MMFDKKQLRDGGLESQGLYYSTYTGIVADNKDPKKRGRVQLKFPMWENQTHDYWAEPKGIFGKASGISAIPAVGDKVWVEFERGDTQFPIWEHRVSEDNALEDLYDEDGVPNKVLVQTPGGNKIIIDDTTNEISILPITGGSIKLNGDTFDGIVKVLAVLGSINTLENKVNGIIAKFNTHTHILALTSGTGTAAVPANPETPISPLTTQADLENPNVLHG